MPSASDASDFRLYHGNSLEVLAGLMAETLREPAPGAGLLAADTILIPQVSMRRWLQNLLAQAHGIAANLRFLTPGEFVREALAANLPGTEDAGSLDAATLQWRLYALLRDPATRRHPALAELLPYLNDDDPLKHWSLAGELASVFEKYQAWRRDWLLGWEAGLAPRDWQAELWRRAAGGLPHRARRIAEYLHRHGASDGALPVGLPTRLFVFACINVSPDVLRVLSTQARVGVLHFYLPTPCRKYWGDLRSLSQRLRDHDDEAAACAESAFAIEENPLLEAWGAAGRDFVAALASYEVVHPSGEIAAYADSEEDPDDKPEKDTLLQRLQRDLLHRRAPAPPSASTPAWRAQVDRTDASLQIHACHTRLREVQVLHDQLRALLEADPTLEPRDIAVLTPDIDPYIPHIQAVFGGAASAPTSDLARASQASLYLPYAVADGSPLMGEPLAEVFLRLLALPSSRFGVNEVLDLLAMPAIAERFDLASSTQERLHHWLGEAGARWGLDAKHRVRHDAPDDAAFTWQFALDRLLLGYASGEDEMLAGVAPWPELEGGSLDALDALIELLRLLARCERAFAQAHTPAQWQQQMLRALDDLLPTRPREPADQRALERLRDVIEEFRAQTNAAGFDASVPPEIVRAHFRARLSEVDTRAPFLSGGITFCRMLPMRLIPFRVICLLGMNDGEVPRRDPAGALNRLAAQLGTTQRQRGDRSLREDDRFLFLQLLVAANDVFYLSYLGADPRDNSPREPSVLVSELLDAAARYHANPDQADPESARKQLVVQHPLQPFAPQAFGAAAREQHDSDPRRFSYRNEWHPGALATQGTRTQIGPWSSSPLPAPAPVDALSLGELRAFLRDPADAFLRQRLDVRLPDAAASLDDVEPLVLPGRGLQRHRLQQAVFAAYVDGDAPDGLQTDLQSLLCAQALLPSGPLGREQLNLLLDEVRPYADAFLRWRNDGTVQPGSCLAETRAFELDLDGVRLHGRIDDLYRGGLARFRFYALHGPAQIAHGLDWLVSSALGDPRPLVQFARTANGPGPHLRASIAPDRARAVLCSLLRLRAYGLREPLPFLPRTGWLWYDAHTCGKDGWGKAEKQWHGDDRSWGEATTPAARLALRGRDPFADASLGEEFRQIACIVFDALVHGRGEGIAT